MEQENDFIKREIQKLVFALMKLIDKTVSADINNFEAVVFETNKQLEAYFGFSTNEISDATNSELIQKVEGLHQEHLEKLIELLYHTIQKSKEFGIEINFKNIELSNKLLLLIDLADNRSKSFSVERMNMKSQLIKNSNK
ncbi:MAG TPA: hypothetical protein VFM72_09360 [Aequorivita sp.]|nr:hypothetical protein [Aequorivita sp.]